ncbi:protein of unknown function UPF0182 [Kribbella flavida DSM 17836]|uniref:UPF0182 protein Kfla_5309 n=1 Tax=Kribbella flavida (strain DSM 17836 / JCM 10339 / NBRC 14399) TaxID=479435 RepID=D2PL68_KRIFD|nr:UPF0182 family protein [Kribbella flavida]ADB34323.1 protein of unknown function UPF0182 [Kribbella flavida DSM 17836]
MSDGVYDLPEEPRRSRRTPGQRPRALLPTIATLIVLLILFSVFTDVWTQRLWYRSVDLSSVFSTVLGTRVLLFVVVGLLMAAAVVTNVVIAYRTRPRVALAPSPSPGFERYGELLQQRGKLAVAVLGALMLIFGGSAASGEWKVFLAWRNRTPFGVNDQHFNMDIAFFVFDYPWLRVLLGFGYSIVLLSLVAAIITHYLYGGFRPSAKGQKASGAAQVQFSVLLGLLVLLKAFSYWLDRYGLTTSDSRLFTGISYTGDNAVLPSKEILAVIALLCAGLFFANVVRKTWLLPGVGTVVLVLSAVLLGALWPAALQQLRVRPSEPIREAAYITKNIEATRQAYGLEKTEVVNYAAKTTTATPSELEADAGVLPGIRLIDPSVVGPTFEQLQQVRGFYSFPSDLDVDRYKIGNEVRDTVIAVREVQVDRLPPGQRNWNNDHTVYTHGYGVVAANGNQRSPDGTPVFSSKDLPPTGDLGKYEPRIYFGEQSPDYSIVGAPEGAPPVELDTPEGKNGGDPTLNTYEGKGGVEIGSFGNRLLYATKFRDANILLSGRVNEASKILYDRNPRERVEKAAPWLTPDGDPYPAVVDGQVVWIVDGYTTSANYPYSQKVALDDSTRDTTTGRGAIATQPSEEINYIRNSVKAVVNAYDGSVELYAWDENDPLLKTWMKAFPGTVKPRADISPALMSHLRYPEDIFKVQRDMLAKYHVRDAGTWYQNSDLWRVPADPTGTGTADSPVQNQPPFYLSLRMPGQETPKFSLTSVYVPNAERENLTAFMAVDAEASSPDYGKFRILRLPGNVQIPGPGQVYNKFQTDEGIRSALLPINQPTSGARAQYGNLLTLPLGGGLLYVQPVYSVRTSGPGSYPVLRYVLVSFGERVAFGSTLSEALTKVFNTSVGNDPDPDPNPNEPTPPPANQTIKQALADADKAFADADAALRRGDLNGYQANIKKAQAAVARAIAAGAQVPNNPTPTPTPTGTPPTPTNPPSSPTG